MNTTEKRKPTPKVIYTSNPQPLKTEFDLIYERYLKWNNCKEYYPIKNKYSRCDFFLTSGMTNGDCSLVVEYKNRELIPVATFLTSIIEKKKLEDNLILAKLVDSHFIYMVEYKEAVVCWLIKPDHSLQADSLLCPKEDGSSDYVLKDVYHLLFRDAELVISKKNFKKATTDQLLKYIKLRRQEI